MRKAMFSWWATRESTVRSGATTVRSGATKVALANGLRWTSRKSSAASDVRAAVPVLFTLAARTERALDARAIGAFGTVWQPAACRASLRLLVAVKPSGTHALAAAEAGSIAAVGACFHGLALVAFAIVPIAVGFAGGVLGTLVVCRSRRSLTSRASGAHGGGGQYEAREKRVQQLDKSDTGHAPTYTSLGRRVTRVSWA